MQSQKFYFVCLLQSLEMMLRESSLFESDAGKSLINSLEFKLLINTIALLILDSNAWLGETCKTDKFQCELYSLAQISHQRVCISFLLDQLHAVVCQRMLEATKLFIEPFFWNFPL